MDEKNTDRIELWKNKWLSYSGTEAKREMSISMMKLWDSEGGCLARERQSDIMKKFHKDTSTITL